MFCGPTLAAIGHDDFGFEFTLLPVQRGQAVIDTRQAIYRSDNDRDSRHAYPDNSPKDQLRRNSISRGRAETYFPKSLFRIITRRVIRHNNTTGMSGDIRSNATRRLAEIDCARSLPNCRPCLKRWQMNSSIVKDCPW